MSFSIYLEEMKMVQNIILDFLENENNFDENFQNLKNVLDNKKIIDDNQKYHEFLYLLLNIANNHHHGPNFFFKIERIFQLFIDKLKINYSNSEIFHIFKSNKRIILFLIEENIIIFDEYIIKKITTDKYLKVKYPHYFAPEIKPFITEEWFPRNDHLIKYLQKELPNDFYEKRKSGENDSSVCKLIQKDMIQEFISFINQKNYSLDSTIERSIYETNLFLIDKSPSLFEYALFYGSTKIIQYLQSSKVMIYPEFAVYLIHSNNLNLFKEININSEKQNNECLVESIKCHHNEITKYINENLIQNDDLVNEDVFSKSLKYHNYLFFPQNFKTPFIFYHLCYYNYASIVQGLLQELQDHQIVNEIIKSNKIKNKNITTEIEENSLHASIRKGNNDVAKLLIENTNVDINSKCTINKKYYYKKEEYVQTALHLAVSNNNLEIVDLLLKNDTININEKHRYLIKTNPNYDQIQEKTALFIAVENSYEQIVKILTYHEKIDVNIKFTSKEEKSPSKIYEERAPLHIACKSMNIDIIKYLLACKTIDTNSTDIYSYESQNSNYYSETTPLSISINNKNSKIVQLLLSSNDINVNLKSKIIEKKDYITEKNKSPLYHAVNLNQVDIAKLLLSHPEINVNDKSKIYSTIKSIYVSMWSKIKKIIITDVVNQCIREETALHLAIKKEYVDIISILLLHKNIDVGLFATINSHIQEFDDNHNIIKDGHKSSYKAPIHYSAKTNVEIIKLLLAHKDINVNAIKNKTLTVNNSTEEKVEKTALHIAIFNKKTEIVEFLLTRNEIDVNIKYNSVTSKKNCSPFDINDTSLILEKNEGTPLHCAILVKNEIIVSLLLQHEKTKVNIKNILKRETLTNKDIIYNKEFTEIQLAAESGNFKIVEYLLSYRPEIEINSLSYTQKLNISGQELIEMNHEYIFDVNKKNALHIATENMNFNIVKLLLEQERIDVNMKSIVMDGFEEGKSEIKMDEKTPLHIAIENEDLRIINLLLKSPNIDLNIKRSYYCLLSIENVEQSYFKTSENTPLHQAIEKGNESIVELLLSHNDTKVNIKKKEIIETKDKECILNYLEYTELQAAANLGNKKIIESLLSRPEIKVNALSYSKSQSEHRFPETYCLQLFGINGNIYIETSGTALQIAVEKKHYEIVSLFLKNLEINVNIKTKEIYEIEDNKNIMGQIEKTILFFAIENQDDKMVELLLTRKDIDVNIKQTENLLSKIIDAPVNDSLYNKKEITPLHLAIKQNNTSIVRQLLKREDTQINVKNINIEESEERKLIVSLEEMTEIHIAAENGNEEIIQLLLSKGQIELNAICRKITYNSCKKEFQIAFGFNYDDNKIITEKKEETALHIAVSKNNLNIVKYLLQQDEIEVNFESITYEMIDNIDNTLSKKIYSPLHIAIQNGFTEIVELLLAREDIDINKKTYSYNLDGFYSAVYDSKKDYIFRVLEMTPLHFAIEYEKASIVKLLLSHEKIQLNVKLTNNTMLSDRDFIITQEDSMEIHHAVFKSNIEILQLLLTRPEIDINAICHQRKYIDLYHLDMDDVFDIDRSVHHFIINEIEETALHIAVQKQDLKSVDFLIKRDDIDINAKATKIEELDEKKNAIRKDEYSVISQAVNLNNFKLTELLLSNKNININEKAYVIQYNENFLTPYEDKVGISYNTAEMTPLHSAILNNNSDIAELLISNEGTQINVAYVIKRKLKGAENIMELKESTEIILAAQQKNIKIIELLLSRPELDVNYISNVADFYYFADSSECELFNIESDEKHAYYIKSSKSALDIAAETNSLESVKLLLSRSDIDVNCKLIKHKYLDSQQNTIVKIEKTPLHIAIEIENADMVDLLLENDQIEVNIPSFETKIFMNYSHKINDLVYGTSNTSIMHLAVSKQNPKIQVVR